MDGVKKLGGKYLQDPRGCEYAVSIPSIVSFQSGYLKRYN